MAYILHFFLLSTFDGRYGLFSHIYDRLHIRRDLRHSLDVRYLTATEKFMLSGSRSKNESNRSNTAEWAISSVECTSKKKV